jgi:hypothetical protein
MAEPAPCLSCPFLHLHANHANRPLFVGKFVGIPSRTFHPARLDQLQSGLDGSTPELSSEQDEIRALRNEDVLEMLGGLSPRIVAEQIKHSPGAFDTSVDALNKLQSQGVPEAVILAMFHAKKRSA